MIKYCKVDVRRIYLKQHDKKRVPLTIGEAQIPGEKGIIMGWGPLISSSKSFINSRYGK